MRRGLALAALLSSTAMLAAPAFAQGWSFQQVATITLPGGKGHGDIATFDGSSQLLYLSMPNDGVVVVDTRDNSVVKYLQNIPSPNGSDWDSDRVYFAAADGLGPGNTPPAGKINDIIVVSKETWKEVGRVQTQGTSPDWLAVDRQAGLIYVDSDDNNWMEVYSTGDKPELKAKWPLYPDDAKTGPDVAALVPSKHVIFQSDDSYVLKVNTTTGAVDAKSDTGVKLTKKGGTKGEVYDAKNNRLWVGTTSKEILVLNADTLAVVAKLPQAGGADVVAFDPGYGLVYVFEGSAEGFDVYDANTMRPVTFIKTGVGNTHTGDVDPATHLVYAFEGDGGLVGVYKPIR
jgi:hypothetical protein